MISPNRVSQLAMIAVSLCLTLGFAPTGHSWHGTMQIDLDQRLDSGRPYILVQSRNNFQLEWQRCNTPNSADETIEACTRVIDSGAVSGLNLSSAYNSRGTGWAAKSQLPQAISDYTQSIRLSPKFRTAYVNRSSAYLLMKEFDLALIDADIAVLLDPRSVPGLAARSVILTNMSQTDFALRDVDAIIRMAPNSFEGYFARGDVYRKMGRLDEARAEYQKGLATRGAGSLNKAVTLEFLMSLPVH